MSTRWLVAYDFSSCASAALDYAAKALAGTGGEVILLYVHEPLPEALQRELVTHVEALQAAAAASQQVADAAAARLKEQVEVTHRLHPGIGLRAMIETGDPTKVIVTTAYLEECEHIVIGTSGEEGRGVGSTTEQVLLLAVQPVTVVRPLGEGGGGPEITIVDEEDSDPGI